MFNLEKEMRWIGLLVLLVVISANALNDVSKEDNKALFETTKQVAIERAQLYQRNRRAANTHNVHARKKRSSSVGCPMSRSRRSTDLKQIYEEEVTEAADVGNYGNQYSAVMALEWTRYVIESNNIISTPSMTALEVIQNDKEVVKQYGDFFNCEDLKVECDQYKYAEYSPIDGVCNNLQNPRQGASFSANSRFLSSDYGDENNLDGTRTKSVDGSDLPGARELSTTLFDCTDLDDQPEDTRRTVVHLSFGQFFDHDLTLSRFIDGHPDDCCERTEVVDHLLCETIKIPENDPHFSPLGKTCMGQPRSAFTFDPCKPDQRVPMNDQTAYGDASQIYGFNAATLEKLRSTTAKGELAVDLIGGHEFPPEDVDESDCRPTEEDKDNGDTCRLAGDPRPNEVSVLLMMHLIWIREHNRIARGLVIINPDWESDRVFKETRKLVQAMLQKIAYYDYLSATLTEARLKDSELNSKENLYDANVNPSGMIENIAAAFRRGHSNILEIFPRCDESREIDDTQAIPLTEDFLRPAQMMNKSEGSGLEPENLMCGLLKTNMLLTDSCFASAVQNELFILEDDSFDLVALNINRGREAGLQSYVKYREFCGYGKIKRFRDLPFTQEVIELLRSLYSNVADIDLFVGGMLEPQEDGAAVGQTFGCLIAKGFERTRKGDRFFFTTTYQKEADGAFISRFTDDQLEQIYDVTLSQVICRNMESLSNVQENAFFIPDADTNPDIDCTEYRDDGSSKANKGLDLEFWREPPTPGINSIPQKGVNAGKIVGKIKGRKRLVNELQKASRLNDELKRGKKTKGKKGLDYKIKRGKAPKKKSGKKGRRMVEEKKSEDVTKVEKVEEELIDLIESML